MDEQTSIDDQSHYTQQVERIKNAALSADDVLMEGGPYDLVNPQIGPRIDIPEQQFDTSGRPIFDVSRETSLDLELPPAPPPARGHEVHRELIGAIEDAITNHPRTQQTLIGPSEIGDPCARCLGKKLLGIPQTRGDAWLPQIGTAVHSWLDDVMTACDCGWRTERKVTVGIIGNRVIRGSCDLFGRHTVVDYKVVGGNTLKDISKITKAPKQEYRVQCHLYGRGYELEGEDVRDVAVLYLPRNSPTLADSVYWTEPYDRDIALMALDRAQRIYDFIKPGGVVDHNALIQLPRAQQCYNCFRYASLPGEDNGLDQMPKQGKPFEGILG